MSRTVAFVMIIGGLVAAVAVTAQDRFDLQVRDDFFAGMFGDRARLERAMRATETELRKNPKNARALVWHGSGLLTRATQQYAANQDREADRLWRRGIEEMDRARSLAPDDIAVQIGRAAVLIGASQSGFDASDSEAVRLLRSAVEDYESVLAKQRPSFADVSEHSRCELLFGLASGWSLLGDLRRTREYLELITGHCKGSAYETEAREYLSRTALKAVDHNCIGCHVTKK